MIRDRRNHDQYSGFFATTLLGRLVFSCIARPRFGVMGRNCILEVCHTTSPFRQDCLETDTHEAHTTEDHRHLLFFPCLLLDRKTERKRIDDLYGRIHDFFLGDCWAASPIFWDGPGVLGGGTIAPILFTFRRHPTCFLASSPAVRPMDTFVHTRAKGTRKRGNGRYRSVLQDWKLKRGGGGNDVYGLRGSEQLDVLSCRWDAGGSRMKWETSSWLVELAWEEDKNRNSAGSGSSLPDEAEPPCHGWPFRNHPQALGLVGCCLFPLATGTARWWRR